MATNTKPGRMIKSVEISLSIMDEILQRESVGVTELSEVLDYSPGAIHTHLQTLKQHDYVTQKGSSYYLGSHLLRMGHHVRERNEHFPLIKKAVDRLADESQELASYVIPENRKGTVLYFSRGRDAVHVGSIPGRYIPLHSTASGKSILAHLDEATLEEYLDDFELRRITPKTIAKPEALKSELELIRERGYATQDQENMEGLRAVAAPIKPNDIVLGSLCISGPTQRFQGSSFKEKLPEQVMGMANELELNIQYSGQVEVEF